MVDNMWNSRPTSVSFWTASPATEPTNVFQTAWPGFPATVPGQASASRPAFVAAECAAAVVSPPVIPLFYAPLFDNSTARSGSSSNTGFGSKEQSRKFFLQRSVLDLVYSHHNLEFNDSELLRWYLCLSPEDRKIILDEGGFHQFLQSHPGLELCQDHVSVKYRFGSSGNPQPTVTSRKHRCQTCGLKKCKCESIHTQQNLEILTTNVREKLSLIGFDGSTEAQDHVCEEACCRPAVHQVHSCALTHNPGFHRPNNCGISPAVRCSSLERCWQTGKSELGRQNSATYVQSRDVTQPDAGPARSEWAAVTGDHQGVDRVQSTQSSDVCVVQPVPAGQVHSIMEQDGSILVCLPGKDLQERHGGVPPHPAPVSSETLKPDESVIRKTNTAEKHTSTPAGALTCDMMVSTEPPPPCTSTHTQTEAPETSDQNVITEVYMSDMDYLTEEFIKLKMAQEPKEKIRSSGCQMGKVCDCLQRVRQAELSLLALQYIMCRQHCCRLFFTSAEQTHLHAISNDTPANIVGVLQKLDSDFEQMKHQILMGVPLEQLQPLSVDCEKITTGGRYVPTLVFGDVLGNISTLSSEEQHKNEAAEETGSLCQVRQRKVKQAKKDKEKTRRAATLLPSSRCVYPNKKLMIAAQKDEASSSSSSEMWYDAEEDLQLPDAQTALDPDTTLGSAGGEVSSSVLLVSNLHGCMTENDVMELFEKFQPSEVNVCTLRNDLRVAMVIVNGFQSAEAAVRELNGLRIHGCALHVEQLDRDACGGRRSGRQDLVSPRWSESPQHATKPKTKTDSVGPNRKSVQLIARPPLSPNGKSRKVVCISPTAKGNSVP